MNILIFSWRGPDHPNAGGAEIATHEHAKAWIKAGHKVTLFTSSYEKGSGSEVIDGVHVIRRGNQYLAVHISAFFWYIFGKHIKYDIVVDQFHGIPFFTPLYVKTKILGFIHEVATKVWGKNDFKKPLNYLPAIIGPIVEPLIFKMYKNIDFMTVSDSTKSDLIGFGIKKEKIFVIHNGINRVSVKNIKKDKILTFLGALSKDKGIEEALRIFSEVKRKDEEWSFSVVGRGNSEYLNYLKRMARDLNIADNLAFMGYVSDKKKYETLAKSFCLINPSVHEGWGLVNIEANSVGTPVIAYKVKGIIDSVLDGKTGMLFEKENVHQIALEIIKLFNDKKRYEIMSKNCLKWSGKFSWEKSAKESTVLVESL